MDIEDAFTQEAIEATGVDVGGHEENELRSMFQQLSKLKGLELERGADREAENIAVLFFVAGRAYQEDSEVPVMMPRRLRDEFLAFLMDKQS